MKRIFSLFLISVLLLSFASCRYIAGPGDKDYIYFEFSNESGNFVAESDNVILTDVDNGNGSIFYSVNEVSKKRTYKLENSKIYVNNKLEFYCTPYLLFDVNSVNYTDELTDYDSTKGLVDYKAELEGAVRFKEDDYAFEDGNILNADKETVGSYTIKNNYVMISFDGETRSYSLFRFFDKDEVQRIGFSDKFFSSTSVIADTVLFTTFNTTQCLGSGKQKLSITSASSDYEIQSISCKLIETYGNDFTLNEDGSYEFKLSPDATENKVSMEITCDGLTKTVEYDLYGLSFDHALFVARNANTTTALNAAILYQTQNSRYSDYAINYEIVSGKEIAAVEEKTLKLTGKGKATLRLIAVLTINGKECICTDEVEFDVYEG